MKIFTIVLALLASNAAMARDARFDGNCAPVLTSLQQRLYSKASDSPAALRDFIFIRRAMLQLDVQETADWARDLARARAACIRESAQQQAGLTQP